MLCDLGIENWAKRHLQASTRRKRANSWQLSRVQVSLQKNMTQLKLQTAREKQVYIYYVYIYITCSLLRQKEQECRRVVVVLR